MYWIMFLCYETVSKMHAVEAGQIIPASTFLLAFFVWVISQAKYVLRKELYVGVCVCACVYASVCCACLKNTGRQIGNQDRKR